MKYLCLACGDESAWEELTREQQQEIIEKCRVHDEKLAADPRVSLYVGLSEGGRLVRQQEGQQVVTDGPFIRAEGGVGGRPTATRRAPVGSGARRAAEEREGVDAATRRSRGRAPAPPDGPGREGLQKNLNGPCGRP